LFVCCAYDYSIEKNNKMGNKGHVMVVPQYEDRLEATEELA